MREKLIDSHVVRVGDELDGDGIRIQVDHEDRTEDVLAFIGPPNRNGHGMAIPRGEHYTLDIVAMMIRADKL
jgi:hypothetical protein